MIEGITSTGFAFAVEEKRLDNMELVDAIAKVDKDPTAVSRVLDLMLGEEQKHCLYDHLRTEDGRVPIGAMTDALTEIFAAGGKQAKNS